MLLFLIIAELANDRKLEQVLQISFTLRNFMWGNWMIGLLVLTGILLTLVTGFIQVRKFGRAFQLVLRGARGKDHSTEDQGDISPFAALMTALAATVGNGNIAGVATAIAPVGLVRPSGCGSRVSSEWPPNMRKVF